MNTLNMNDLAEQLQDLLNNYSCSCNRTLHHPCPRCQVSIEQSKELLERFKKEQAR